MARRAEKQVLIVEDAPEIQVYLAKLLQASGYTSISAQNGEEALKILNESEELPDMVLLDLMMPVMDGFRFREEQEKDPRLAEIPVVVMTSIENGLAMSVKIGAHDFLKKPFGGGEKILRTLARVMEAC